MRWIDTHAHLYDKLFKGRSSDLIRACSANQISKICMPNIDLSTLKPMLALASSYPERCFPMLGLHPCYVKENYRSCLAAMESYLLEPAPNFIAIGEIGLDLYRDRSFIEEQQAALAIQLGWAKRYQLPVVLHARDSLTLLIELLKNHPGVGGVIHCFTGTLAEARALLQQGFYLGFGGLLTYPKQEQLAAVVEALPLNRILLETDAPYLAPVPYRGQTNSPEYLPIIAKKIADLKKISLEALSEITCKNAEQLFKL